MQIKIQMTVTYDNHETVQEIAQFNRQELSAATLGLTLEEAKMLTSQVQKNLVTNQVTNYLMHERICADCGGLKCIKGYHMLTYRTLFGKIALKSPRLWSCKTCHSQEKSFSPLAELLVERTSPELSYLQTKWVSLMSYGMTVKLLEEVLPLATCVSSVFYQATHVATRLEQELAEERPAFVDGCPRDWGKLPRPASPLSVAIDGGYVHAREKDNRKAGWFEVIVGKSLQQDTDSKRFGFVTCYDTKPKRRLHEMLKEQGLQMNQDITFLTDGGDTVRSLPLYLSPQSEHIIDWFHITMRITVLKQMAKGIKEDQALNPLEELESIKWYLWHGNTFQALEHIELLNFDLEDEHENSKRAKLQRAVDEFYNYIEVNQGAIANYGQRYRCGEAISTSFAESTVNELIAKRMVKKQQMRWTKKGAHLLLQLRIKTLNHDLKKHYENWYPAMAKENTLCPSVN